MATTMKSFHTALLVALALASGGCVSSGATSGHSTHAGHASAIAWTDWTPAAFERAAAENRLLLVTVVTTWCHWCHVMDEKTWGDARIADLLDKHFVMMRVDADARPDIAERYAEWAWPATAVMTPKGGGVVEIKGYKDPEAMLALLSGIVDDHRAGRPVARRAAPIDPAPVANAQLTEVHARVLAQLDRFYDEKEGGWGKGKQKYPLAAPLALSFRRAARGDVRWQDRAVFTLTQEQKILDAVDGGMFQYSVFGDWDHPHYEKLAFIQGWALSNFSEGFAATGDERFRTAAEGVVAYVGGDLLDESGGFYANQDADVGTRGERAFVVGKEYYGLDAHSRRKVGAPFIDKNIYAAHNGEIILGLADFVAVTGDRSALALATRAADTILRTHSLRGGVKHAAADSSGRLYLADQVAMGRALLRLFEVTQEERFLVAARAIATTLQTEFVAPDGGFFAHTLTASDVNTLERRKPFKDNAKAARFMLRLAQHQMRGSDVRENLRTTAEDTLKAFASPAFIADQYRMVGDYALALDDAIHEPFHLSVVGHPSEETTQLFNRALALHAPGAVVDVLPPGERFPDLGRPVVFVCTESFCSAPIFSTAAFEEKALKVLAPRPNAEPSPDAGETSSKDDDAKGTSPS